MVKREKKDKTNDFIQREEVKSMKKRKVWTSR